MVFIAKFWWLWTFLSVVSILSIAFIEKSVDFFKRMKKDPEAKELTTETKFMLVLCHVTAISIFLTLFCISTPFFFGTGSLLFIGGIGALIAVDRDYKKQIDDLKKAKRKQSNYIFPSEIHNTQYCAVGALMMTSILPLAGFVLLFIGFSQKFHLV